MEKDFTCIIEGDKLRCKAPVSEEDILSQQIIAGGLLSKKTVVISGAGLITWGLFIFAIGLLTYGNLDSAIMVGLFTVSVAMVSCLFIIPYAGIVLWILAISAWGWFPSLTGTLGLPMDVLTGFVWYLTSIFTFVIGVFFTVMVTIAIASVLKR